MNHIPATTGRPLICFGLMLTLTTAVWIGSLTGCTSPGSRYKQSTGESIDDRGLSSAVKKALGNDTQFKYEDVNVVTFKGVVQLSGFVSIEGQKSRAGDLAKNVRGVNEIQNNITVKE